MTQQKNHKNHSKKPLYYFWDSENFYFGSQINQIHMLSEKKFEVNESFIED